MAATSKGPIVYRIMISQSAFEVTLQAVHNLSRRNKRHEVFSAVLAEAIETFSGWPEKVLEGLTALEPLKGDIRMFIRVPPGLQIGFDHMRSQLSDVLGPSNGTRETVVACSLLIAPRN